jgi:CHAT domain-containing protein
MATVALAWAVAATSATAPAGDEAARLFASGDCTGALRIASDAIAGADAAHGAQSPASADALARFSRIALDCRRPDAPGLDAALSRELAWREHSAGLSGAATIEVRLLQARRAMQLNRIEAALAVVQAVHDVPQFASLPPQLRARVLGLLASLYNQRADAQQALDNAQAAAALVRGQARGDPAILIDALQDQGMALTRMRQGAKALVPLGEAETLARERFGTDRREYAETLRYLAYAKRDAGDFGGAIGAFEQALAIQNAQHEVDEHQVAVLELNLGQTLKVSGDSARALTHYEQALALDARAPDPAGRTRPAILHGLANLYRDRNDNERALTLYAQAVPLFAEVFGENSVQLAQVLNNYGNAEGNLGHYDAAIALYQRALTIARERKSVDPGDYVALTNIAMLRIWQQRYAEAEAPFRESLQRMHDVAVGSESNVLFAQLGLTASLWGQGRIDEAFDAAVLAEQLRQAGLRLAISHLGEGHAIGFQEYQRPTLDFVIAIAVASGKREQLQRAWELSMAARDQITAQIAQRLAAARAAHDAKLAPLWQAWRDASGAMARAELETEAGSAKRVGAQDALDRAERALAAAAYPFAAAVEPRGATLADVRRALPPDTALVLFVPVQPRVASDFAKPEAEQREPDLYALLLPKAGAEVRAVKLGSLGEATQRVESWTAALGDRSSALASVESRGRAVRQTLWEPLASAISAKRVLMIPTGSLFRVPWSALPDRSGYLVDGGWTIHSLNHERELLTPQLQAQARLLAVADPSPPLALPLASACPGAGAPLPALPGARGEVERLGTLWREHFSGADSMQSLVGADATEARVRSASTGADVLHFATHSIGTGTDCALAATRGFALVTDQPADAGAASTLAPTALALAGGAAGHSDDDGLLGAEEIATLDLSRVHWAVLAACTTAAGATRHYEGLFGLSRAFRLAGARTVIMSLWPVDDSATAQWTEALYVARLARGLDTAAAMQAAQRDVLAARRQRGESVHPYYWAAFVAAGDWR